MESILFLHQSVWRELQSRWYLFISSGLAIRYTTRLTEQEFSLNCQTVTDQIFTTPANDGSIFQNRSKCISDPGNDGSICHNRSKSIICGLNLLHALELISDLRTVTTTSGSPQVTTDPSARIAAKARTVAWICCTPLSWSRTAELSPPESAPPQETIALPPWHHKAKALIVAASCGWSTRAVRHSPSSISASSKVLLRSTRTRFLPVISLRYFFPKARWAIALKSWTVEEGSSLKSSACPFGKATFIWGIWDVLRSWRRVKTSAMNLYFTLWALFLWLRIPAALNDEWWNTMIYLPVLLQAQTVLHQHTLLANYKCITRNKDILFNDRHGQQM